MRPGSPDAKATSKESERGFAVIAAPLDLFGFRVDRAWSRVSGFGLGGWDLGPRTQKPRPKKARGASRTPRACLSRRPPRGLRRRQRLQRERYFFIDNLLVQIHSIIEMILVVRKCAITLLGWVGRRQRLQTRRKRSAESVVKGSFKPQKYKTEFNVKYFN